ncbi:MAG: hypothetical protein JXB35_15045, partial [Anaerolineae bacterium]|nr:hypothetical protein [Anaerolineae bacterium]
MQKTDTSVKKRPETSQATRPGAIPQVIQLSEILRQFQNPGQRSVPPADVMRLQHVSGNQSTTHLIQAKLRVGPAGDRYEREADRVADQVMRMPGPLPRTAQRQAEEEELQTKPAVQRAPEDEEEIQMQPAVQRAP